MIIAYGTEPDPIYLIPQETARTKPYVEMAMKRLLLIMTMILWASSAQAATWYVDGGVAVSGNGLSWRTAWKTIADITNLGAGDTVYFSGGPSGRIYMVSNWTPTGGTTTNPITYAAGQDPGHTGPITFSGSGNFLNGNVNNITINGKLNGKRNITVANSYSWTVYNDTNGDHHVRLLYINFMAPIWAHGGYWELGYSSGTSIISTLDDSFIAHLGVGGTSGYGINSVHHNILTVNRKRTAGQGQDLFKWIGNVDIHDNMLLSVYNANYTGTQHNDGIQTAASFVRIYNNYFENFISFPIYNEMYGDTKSWRIYNNVMKADESSVDWNAYRCIAVLFNDIASPNSVASDYIVANNTCIGGDTTQGVSLKGIHFKIGARGVIGSDVYLVNNLVYGHPEAVVWSGPGTPTVSNNVHGTANLAFVNNAFYPTADFRLTASATAAINQGINPSYLLSVYTTDKSGASRMLKSTWDIGAHAFSALDQVLPIPPLNLNVK
jgi:hypothetical protein